RGHRGAGVGRRWVRIKLTEKGRDVCETVRALYEKHVRTVEQVGGINADEFAGLNKALHRLERFWTDQILYRLETGTKRVWDGGPGHPVSFWVAGPPPAQGKNATR